MPCYSNLNSMERQPVNNLKIIRHPLYLPKQRPWFDLRVFYVRVSNFEVDDSTPEHLTLNHIPLGPDTILEVNGGRSSAFSERVSSQLRRDRMDKNSEEATFVNTDSIRITGSVRFEVYDGGDLLLSGLLELSDGNGVIGDTTCHTKTWNIKCQSHMSVSRGLIKGKQNIGADVLLPTIEVYVAGCFSGTPIILTKTLHIGLPKKQQAVIMLDSIPEGDSTDSEKETTATSSQVPHHRGYKSESNYDEEHETLYSRPGYIEEEGGELSWFNAGVRVGVGIGLGICVGVGLGVGLLLRSYQSASRNFKRRLR